MTDRSREEGEKGENEMTGKGGCEMARALANIFMSQTSTVSANMGWLSPIVFAYASTSSSDHPFPSVKAWLIPP